MYASGAGLGASKGKDITKVAGMDYTALSKESVSNNWNREGDDVGNMTGLSF